MESSTFSLARLQSIQSHLLSSNPLSKKKAPEPEPEQLLVEEGTHFLKVVLNRPKQLNSLTTKMMEGLSSIITKADQLKKPVLLLGNDKAFCAGRDLKEVQKEVADTEGYIKYLQQTHSLLYRYAALPSPTIAICDGYAFGRGCGLLTLSKIRIVTETAVILMPQAKNGTLSAEGFSYACSKLPKYIGKYLVLTGIGLKGAEIWEAGLADHFVLRKNLPSLMKALENHLQNGSPIDRLKEVISKYEEKTRPKKLKDEEEIKKYFSDKYLKDIIARLDRESHREPKAGYWLAKIKEGCPLMLLHNNFLMENSAGKTLEEAFSLEHHFLERVRVEDVMSGFARVLSQNIEVPTSWSMSFQDIRTFNEDDLITGSFPVYDAETLSQQSKCKLK